MTYSHEHGAGASDDAPVGKHFRREAPPAVASPPPVAAEAEVRIDLRDEAMADGARERGPLAGKVAVVTGGGSGIGRAMALALVDAGARVCVLGRNTTRLRETTAAAGQFAPILYLQCDLGSVAEVESAADFIARFDRPVDVLVHGAGVRVAGSVATGSVADLDEQYLVNVRGPYLLTQMLLPQLTAGPGHVVFLNSRAGRDVTAGDTQFSMTKFGLRALADGLRAEAGDAGVRVTTVYPGDETSDVEPRLDDVAAAVVGVLEMGGGVEIADLDVRPTAGRG